MACQSPEIVAYRSACVVGVKAEEATTDHVGRLLAAESARPSAKGAFAVDPRFDSLGQVAIVEASRVAGRRGADEVLRRLAFDCPAWSGTEGTE